LVNCRIPETGLPHGFQEKIELEIAESSVEQIEIETRPGEGRAIEGRAFEARASENRAIENPGVATRARQAAGWDAEPPESAG